LTVSCAADGRIGFPQLSQSLVLDDFGNVAGAAPSVEGPTLWTEVPIPLADALELSAELARLPPLPRPFFASAVNALVVDA